MKILLVEDSARLRRSLAAGFEQLGFCADLAVDGEQGYQFAKQYAYEVVVLDIMMPRMDGLTLLGKLRDESFEGGVLMLTAKDQLADRIKGLDMGADDYLVKPFAFDELVARIKALGRRQSHTKNPQHEVEGVAVDTVKQRVSFKGQIVALTAKEYQLLSFLVARSGQVFSHDQLIDYLYDAQTYVSRNAVEAHVSMIRKKFKMSGAPNLIKTRRGFGYTV